MKEGEKEEGEEGTSNTTTTTSFDTRRRRPFPQVVLAGATLRRINGVSGSALTGVALIPPQPIKRAAATRKEAAAAAAGGCFFVSVGYDQRLTLWRLTEEHCIESRDRLLLLAKGAAAAGGTSDSTATAETAAAARAELTTTETAALTVATTYSLRDGPAVTGLEWVKATMVDVNDVAGLAVSEEEEAEEEGSDTPPPSSSHSLVRVAVFGQGVQVVELRQD
jgi:hypothetical protein